MTQLKPQIASTIMNSKVVLVPNGIALHAVLLSSALRKIHVSSTALPSAPKVHCLKILMMIFYHLQFSIHNIKKCDKELYWQSIIAFVFVEKVVSLWQKRNNLKYSCLNVRLGSD